MKIDFYVLDGAGGQKSLHFACKLVEKNVMENKSVFINAASREEAERVDALLWTFRDDSFVPHQLDGAAADFAVPVCIGSGNAPQTDADILLNLSVDIPAFYQRFKHIIEIVFSDPVVQQSARVRYKHYRDQGCEINTIKLNANEL